MSEHKIVPIEPTKEMIVAGFRAWNACEVSKGNDSFQDWKDAYKAMIAAAPESNTITSLENELAECMAVNLVMREALQKISDMDYGPQSKLDKCAHDKYQFEDCEQCVIEVADAALAIKPGDVELVEMGKFTIHEDKIGERYHSQSMAYNYDEFEIGKPNKLYTIQTKSNTE